MYREDLAFNNLQWLICPKPNQTKSYIYIYMYREDLALNNLQWLICHKKTIKMSLSIYGIMIIMYQSLVFGLTIYVSACMLFLNIIQLKNIPHY